MQTNRRQRRHAFGPDRRISMCVYSITHRKSGKQYVGLTTRIAGDRWRNHVWSSERDGRACPLISRAMNKYGTDAFDFEVIDIAESVEQLANKEQFWIKELNTLAPNGYNLSTGGYVGSEVSDETREKLRAHWKDPSAKVNQPEWSAKQAEARLKWWAENPEYRTIAANRARNSFTGKSRPQHVIDAVVAVHKGAKRTESHKINSARAHMNGRVIHCCNGESYLSSYEAAAATGCDKDKIGSVCTGKRKSTGGMKFWYGVEA